MDASNKLKTLVIALVMAALAFVVGSMAADGRLQSSLLPIMAVVGIFVLVYLGRNCWWLVFIVPAISSFLPIPSVFGLPLAQLTAAVVFVYWLLMWVMGYVEIRWRGVAWVDGPVMLFFIYFMSTYVMNPVSIGIFGDEDAEYIGGKDYIFMLLGLLTYCAISLIPCSISQLMTITKWTIVLSLGLTCFSVLKIGSSMGVSGIAAGAEGGRFGLFSGLGSILGKVMCSWYSPAKLVSSPGKLLLFFLAVFGLAMGGWREAMLSFGIFMCVCALCYRQLIVWIVTGAVALALLYYLSSQDILLSAPHGVQRVLTPIPGLKLKKDIVAGTEHSTEWRKEMWRWAFNPRLGYIKDYVWGDGFGVSRSNLRLTTINMNRGRMQFGNQEFFAETGTWHSGAILTIHRIGYVGLGFLALWIFVSIVLIVRLGSCLRGRKEMPYALYLTAGYVGSLVQFCISAGTYPSFFCEIVSLALAKIMYAEAMKEGLIEPMFTRKVYVPLMMQEADSRRMRQARETVQVLERTH